MKKWVCSVCGYVWEGENPPEKCPQCGVPGSKFTEQKGEMLWAAEHVIGVGKSFGADVPEDVQKEIIDGLRANFSGECTEVGMYLAMSRAAYREGYPEIGDYWHKAGPVSYTHLDVYKRQMLPRSSSVPTAMISAVCAIEKPLFTLIWNFGAGSVGGQRASCRPPERSAPTRRDREPQSGSAPL